MKRELRAAQAVPEVTGPVLDRAAQFLFFGEIARTMWVVLEQIFRPPYTIMYPYEKGPLSPRFRGEHALRRYPSGNKFILTKKVKSGALVK